MDLRQILAVARGDEPADLVLRDARLVNVLSGEIHRTDVAVAGDTVAALAEGIEGREVVDLDGRYLAPGWIDAHVHIESSLVPPREFARALLPRGVTGVVADPHEIANVRGIEGIHFLLSDARETPLDVHLCVPSCVPASSLATSGARLEAEDLAALGREPSVAALGEVMNFPAVVRGDSSVLAKLRSFRQRRIDGHCPGLSGRDLCAYVAAGIRSDHEATTVEEAREKLRLGITVFLREGSATRNLRALLPLVSDRTERRLCLCTDDRGPDDLLEEGSIDHMVRTAIAEGVDPVAAIRMGSLNTADHFGLDDRGAVAPGRRADLVVFSELREPRAERVYKDGRLVARDGALLLPRRAVAVPEAIRHTVRVDWARVDLGIAAKGKRVRAIRVVPDQLVTEHVVEEVPIVAGRAVADPVRDLLKMAVIERHRGSGRVGLGFVLGLGLERGALASTVAHDHHNLVVIGADDPSMQRAARAVADAGGGQAVADADALRALLPLPIAGLMSERPIEEVREQRGQLLAAARALGCPLRDPFMSMSFLALEVVPSLKLTDMGLVDVDCFDVVPLFVGEEAP